MGWEADHRTQNNKIVVHLQSIWFDVELCRDMDYENFEARVDKHDRLEIQYSPGGALGSWLIEGSIEKGDDVSVMCQEWGKFLKRAMALSLRTNRKAKAGD
jgi:hypothetical protein